MLEGYLPILLFIAVGIVIGIVPLVVGMAVGRASPTPRRIRHTSAALRPSRTRG